jgi:CDP-diacylglycerol--glycerol-3-phosphate 3-phosphatidyltransferase
LNGWFAFIIIGRELLVTGFRLVASGEGVVIAANNLGKLKMIFQTIAVSWMLFEPKLQRFYFWGSNIKPGDILMVIAVILTAASGYVYIKDNIHFIKKDI